MKTKGGNLLLDYHLNYIDKILLWCYNNYKGKEKTKMKCNNCENKYLKDINYDEENPEYVYICGKDNHYIGYPEDCNIECEIEGGN